MQEEILSAVIAVRRKLDSVTLTDGKVQGELVLTKEIEEKLRFIDSAEIELTRDGENQSLRHLSNGDSIELSYPNGFNSYYETWESFIEDNLLTEPPFFYIEEFSFFSNNIATSTPTQVERYRQTLRLWQSLLNLADHNTGTSDRLFIFSSSTLEIQCDYCGSHLKASNKLPDFLENFGENGPRHKEQEILFKRSLFKHLKNTPEKERFSRLLEVFDSVYTDYWQNYRLYVESVDFDGLYESYLEKHTKLVTEFNSVLGGVQTAIIGLPIASFLILDKFTISESFNAKNIVLFFGALLFSVIMLVLSKSQGNTLYSAKHLNKQLKRELETCHPTLSNKLTPSLKRVCSHAMWTQILLWVVRIAVAVMIAVSIVSFIYVSAPSFRYWIQNATTITF